MAIKLLIADVDGTLLTGQKTLTPRTCEAVDRLRARGVRFTITSGRPPRGLAALVAPLKLTAPLAGFNGGMYVQPDLTTVLAQRTIPSAVARQAVDYLLSAGLDVWVYQGSDWFLRKKDAPRVARETRNVGFEPTVTENIYGVLDDPIKVIGVSEDRSLIERCERDLRGQLGAEASVVRSHDCYLDITHPEANKGMVVREAARLLQIPIDEIATIGDMSNDVPMLSIAGFGIAMGNASTEVQGVARHVTKSNNEDGFAHAVDTFVLGNPPLAQTGLGLPPRTRACLFGLEGVLIQSTNLQARAWKQLFDHHLRARARAAGQPFVPFDVVHDFGLHLERKPPSEGVRSFLTSRGIELPESTVDALIARKDGLLIELLRSERVATYEGSVRYLEAAHAAGLRTAVVSSSNHCAEVLQSAGIADIVDAQVLPARDAYLAAADELGVNPDEAVVFEEDLHGLETARADHFGYIVGVDRLGRTTEARRHGADVVVTDLSSLFVQDGPSTPPRP
jgi:Cof subfamily protein (haloacid dehalogenase superfamily)/HAD superfamily hydrolase (TIGR01509 family)